MSKAHKADEADKAQVIAISRIIVNQGTQIRARINQEVVAEYAELIKAKHTMPALDVVSDGKLIWLVDGFHRLKAAVAEEFQRIRVVITTGTLRDAVLQACMSNHSHGLRRTNEDKRRCVFAVLNDEEWRNKPNTWIGEKCGVSSMYIGNMREKWLKLQMPTKDEAHLKDSVRTSEGRMKIGQVHKNRAKREAEALRKPEPMKDKVGRALTEAHLKAAFAESYVFDDVVLLLNEVLRTIKDLAERPIGTYLPLEAIEVDVKNIRTGVKWSAPYAVCPYCHGHGTDCKACKGLGWANRAVYEAAPGEMKV